MPSPQVPYIFLPNTLISAAEVNANFDRLEYVLLNLDQSNTILGFGASGHGDMSALTTIFHSDDSIAVSNPKYTSTTLAGAIGEIASFTGYSTGTIAGSIRCWGKTYNGRVLDFTTGTYSGGAGAPGLPAGYPSLVESFGGHTGSFSSPPIIITSLLYNPVMASGGSPSLRTDGIDCYANPITAYTSTFIGAMTGEAGTSPGWLYWIAIGA